MALPSQDQRYNVRSVTVVAGATERLTYDFRPDQITIIIMEGLFSGGIFARVAGTQGGTELPFLTQGPFIFPGVSENQIVAFRNADAISHTLTVVAQKGYPPTSLSAPTITSSVGPGVFQTLTDGATIAWDVVGGNAQVTIAGNRAMASPTGFAAGLQYFLIVKQDVVGGRTLTWGAAFRFPGSATPQLSTAPNAVDLLTFSSDGVSLLFEGITRDFDTPGFYQTLTDGANIAWDLSRGVAQVTLAGNRAMSNPTDGAPGARYSLFVVQDATGTRLLTWGANYKFPGGASPQLSVRAGAIDLLNFVAGPTGFVLFLEEINRDYGTFSPLNIPQCKLWYDASQLTGLIDGDQIATWTDKSGNGFDATQGVAANRPLYKTGILNGYPVARFDGTDTMAEAGYAIPVGSTVFVVTTRTGGAGLERHAISSTTGGKEKGLGASAANNWMCSTDAVPTVITDGAVVAGAWKLLCSRDAAAYCEFFINGASIGSSALVAAYDLLGIGTWGTGNEWIGDIAEIIVYGSNLSVAQRQQVESHLRAKYNLW